MSRGELRTLRAVKYCGGCNPRYDRSAEVRRMEARLGEQLPAAQPGKYYDEVYVICGCPARCADVSPLSAKTLHYICNETGTKKRTES